MIKKNSEEFVKFASELDKQYENASIKLDKEIQECNVNDICDTLIDCYEMCQEMRQLLPKAQNERELRLAQYNINIIACVFKMYKITK